MGYSHYWNVRQAPTDLDWIKFVRTLEELDAHTDFRAGITFGKDSDSVIVDGGWERLHISRNDRGFNFCKTNRSDRDRYVVAAMLIAKYAFGDKIAISSDGGWVGMHEGRQLFSAVTGHTAPERWLDRSALTEEELQAMAEELMS